MKLKGYNLLTYIKQYRIQINATYRHEVHIVSVNTLLTLFLQIKYQ
jgi:hypothetical protein